MTRQKTIRFASVCDGIAAAGVAWKRLPITDRSGEPPRTFMATKTDNDPSSPTAAGGNGGAERKA